MQFRKDDSQYLTASDFHLSFTQLWTPWFINWQECFRIYISENSVLWILFWRRYSTEVAVNVTEYIRKMRCVHWYNFIREAQSVALGPTYIRYLHLPVNLTYQLTWPTSVYCIFHVYVRACEWGLWLCKQRAGIYLVPRLCSVILLSHQDFA